MTSGQPMLPVLIHVARDRARRERRAIAVERCSVHWTCRAASTVTPAGYERVATIPYPIPDTTAPNPTPPVHLASQEVVPRPAAVSKQLSMF